MEVGGGGVVRRGCGKLANTRLPCWLMNDLNIGIKMSIVIGIKHPSIVIGNLTSFLL